ncbi:TSUP family transporter [Photobacterium sp. DNB23_23_1]|uniref:Probable membrane transporter protein n=1 Tax=Photobacterium pectinilyticum TaxID=2906793 RepID=A0ABT1N4Z8_9GAMM|nr:sulfite exporter TauE/SafE family protein [Photobacterium sp. ZSDE20]MCQ1059797.1 sulfite exporter TauE/SafE family protein [Photobacterium sp. ZSDE20]MDD1826146.1 sulfite exporter TauE/SafE family protein [Photobacterium sp. ZSDE20]
MIISIVIPATLFFAAFVRGYTGFGFSAIAILVLTLHYPVAETVPAVLLLDLLISLPLVASSWDRTDFRALRRILLATFAGVPVGLALLHWLPETSLQLLVPATVLAMALLPRFNHAIARKALASPVLCGIMSGWTTSAVSAGGAPVVIHLRYSGLPVSQQRDTLISYFFLTTCLAVSLGYAVEKQFYFLPEAPLFTGLLAVVGVTVGQYLFRRKHIAIAHHGAYYLLLLLSGWLLIRAITRQFLPLLWD